MAAVTSASIWRCRVCRVPLGRVEDGVLAPSVVGVTLDRQGVGRVPCPRCGAVRLWKPVRSGLTEDRPMAAASSGAFLSVSTEVGQAYAWGDR